MGQNDRKLLLLPLYYRYKCIGSIGIEVSSSISNKIIIYNLDLTLIDCIHSSFDDLLYHLGCVKKLVYEYTLDLYPLLWSIEKTGAALLRERERHSVLKINHVH